MTTRGTFLYLASDSAGAGGGSDVGVVAARRAAAQLYAQWLEGGKSSQTDLARLLKSFLAQHDALLDLAVAAGNTAPRFALHASRAAALGNAAAALCFPPVAPPFHGDTTLVCECLAAIACVFAARGTDLFTAAALAKVCADYAGRARGNVGEDSAATALRLLDRYWLARAHAETALVDIVPFDETPPAELAQSRAHARFAMATLDAALAAFPAKTFTVAAIDRSAFLRLKSAATAREKQLDQRLAYHEIRGLRLDDSAATAPPPTPTSELTLPVIDPSELYDFDAQFSTETLKARADAAAAAASVSAPAPAPAPVSYEAARAEMLPLLLGAGAERALKRFRGADAVRMEVALMRAWLAEQQRLAKVFLDTRPAAMSWRKEMDALIKALDGVLLRDA